MRELAYRGVEGVVGLRGVGQIGVLREVEVGQPEVMTGREHLACVVAETVHAEAGKDACLAPAITHRIAQ